MAEGSQCDSRCTKETEKCLDKEEQHHHHHHQHHYPHVHIKKETSIILRKKEFIFCLIGGVCLVAGLVFFIIAMYSIRNCCACNISQILPHNHNPTSASGTGP